MAGHPVAWVNNQFRQYVYDVTDMLASPSVHDKNLTVAFESAWLYGLNVTARPDVEWVPGDVVSTIDSYDFNYVLHFTKTCYHIISSNTQQCAKLCVRFNQTLGGTGYVDHIPLLVTQSKLLFL